MAKFRKIPVVVEAVQWWKHGDVDTVKLNPQCMLSDDDAAAEGLGVCSHCGSHYTEHGWISTLEGGHIVCSGDWIITGVSGEQYPCKPDIFDLTYEKV